MLHINRAHELTKCLHGGSPIPEHLHLAPYTSAHAAFAHRFGIQELPVSDLLTVLTPPSFTPIKSERQEHLHTLGSDFIMSSSVEHVKRKYPKLFNHAFRLGVQTFTCEKNIALLGGMFGIEHALINVIGLREPIPKNAEDMAARIKFLVLPPHVHKLRIKEPKEYRRQRNHGRGGDKSDLYSRAVTSIVGACLERFGTERTHRFLTDRLFSAYLDPKRLVRSKNPAIDLAKYIQEHEREKIYFRMLGENGRKSHNSMFLVGVYLGRTAKMLGEGYGASIYLAQQRAALDALRKIQL